jgi:hypothetical protein
MDVGKLPKNIDSIFKSNFQFALLVIDKPFVTGAESIGFSDDFLKSLCNPNRGREECLVIRISVYIFFEGLLVHC